MHGYRDHCIRKYYPTAHQFYCPFFTHILSCPCFAYRQKLEEYPAHHQKRPQNPLPGYIPKLPAAVRPIDISTISPCAHKYTYLWLKNGESFWAYIVYVGKRAVSGWRNIGGRWKQFGLHLKQIKNFICT